MTRLYRLAILAFAAMTIASCGSDYEFAYLYEDLPFEMDKVERPQIPAREVDIRDFGGVGDGVTLNSDAFSIAAVFSARHPHSPTVISRTSRRLANIFLFI